jgi:hypothetical protein
MKAEATMPSQSLVFHQAHAQAGERQPQPELKPGR